MARSRTLGQNLKELLANALDAGATQIAMTCEAATEHRRDRSGLSAYQVTCADNGRGCPDPEMLRTIGSSTSDFHPETRGRFGQGLIDVLAACETAEIRTLRSRLVFDDTGCVISRVRNAVAGLTIEGLLRHPGDGFAELRDYFQSIILPAGVELDFNGDRIAHRPIERRIESVKLQTVVYDSEKGRDRKFLRQTAVELVCQANRVSMIYELGIPVDTAPWSLPMDINVLQKTPLDTERNILPDTYKESLVHSLIAHVSDLYEALMDDRNEVPKEIRNDSQNAVQLHESAQERVVEITIGTNRGNIARENPFDQDNDSEAAELRERCGRKPVNTGSLPDGIRTLLTNTPTVAALHDELCKANFRVGVLPPETERQMVCLRMYSELATAILETRVSCDRMMSESIAAVWSARTISLNIEVSHIWNDPLGEKSVALILHECAHHATSGHSLAFQDEVARLGGRLAGWVAENREWWVEWQAKLYRRS
ncbi:MAG: hypothetical protein HZA46_02185 [Planctomycetales bacterium]|nr:hypothetical protein [Planctomycetales bacterium]